MEAIAGNCHIRAVGKGQFTGQLADFKGCLFQNNTLPTVAGGLIFNCHTGAGNCGSQRLIFLFGMIAGPVCCIFFVAHIPLAFGNIINLVGINKLFLIQQLDGLNRNDIHNRGGFALHKGDSHALNDRILRPYI